VKSYSSAREGNFRNSRLRTRPDRRHNLRRMAPRRQVDGAPPSPPHDSPILDWPFVKESRKSAAPRYLARPRTSVSMNSSRAWTGRVGIKEKQESKVQGQLPGRKARTGHRPRHYRRASDDVYKAEYPRPRSHLKADHQLRQNLEELNPPACSPGPAQRRPWSTSKSRSRSNGRQGLR